MSGLPRLNEFPYSSLQRDGRYKRPKLRGDRPHRIWKRSQRKSLPSPPQVPVELLDETKGLNPRDVRSLASLALANSISLYLARPCQFKDIRFDYSHRSNKLVRHLAVENLDGTKEIRSVPLGIRFRRVIFELPMSFAAIDRKLNWPMDCGADDVSNVPPQPTRLTIPMLASGMFNNLRRLSLLWGDAFLAQGANEYKSGVFEASLAGLGTIASLEELCLRAGCSTDLTCSWLIDHDMLRCQLNGLSRLRKLALINDTYYRPELEHISPAEYYERRIVIDSDRMDAAARPRHDANEDYELELDKIVESLPVMSISKGTDQYVHFDYREQDDTDKRTWERAHRNRMLLQAEAYAQVLPELEWMYCGQRPMEIRAHRGEDGIVCKEAVPLGRQRVS
ncbi:hypothetical protein MKX08_002978 [Trichoderma sp. CBMAI-0020]|nr:hypothetical protein MKX08_002978 [Trichoderma sp. CBMAI-0020]